MAPFQLITAVLLTACFFVTADIAPGIVSPDSRWPAEDKVFQMFYNLCLGGKVGEAGMVAPMSNHQKSFVYCRQPGFGGGSQPSKPQVIFLQPPGIDQKHNVIVNALKSVPGEGASTKVFVVPPKVTNQYNVEVKHAPPREGEKPAVFYLKGETASRPPHDTYEPPPPKTVGDLLENLPGPQGVPWGV